MADLRESFPILENSGTQAGEPLHKVLEGDTPTAKNAMASLSFKDSAGNLVYPTLDNSGALPVTLEGAKICRTARGTAVGSQSSTVVATIVLTNGKAYENLDWVVSCFRDAIFEIVKIDDVGGTDTETILADVLVGAGDYTDSGELKCQAFTAPATDVNHLVLRAKNINATSDFRGSLSIGEIV